MQNEYAAKNNKIQKRGKRALEHYINLCLLYYCNFFIIK